MSHLTDGLHHPESKAAPDPRKLFRRTVWPQSAIQSPVTVDEFAEFLEDPCPPDPSSVRYELIETLLRTGAQRVVEYTDREMLEREIVTTFDAAYGVDSVPAGSLSQLVGRRPVWLNLPRVASDAITSVETIDDDGNATALAADDYEADTISEPHRLRLLYFEGYSERVFNALRVTYTAGNAAGSVPSQLRMAVLHFAAYLYDRRGMDVTKAFTQSGALDLASPFRVSTGL